MTNATKARDAAQHCEAKKHALRQTQDGIVVAFVLHPSEVPPSLQLAALGTRYMLALVEIGDDEAPVNRKDGDASAHHGKSTADIAPASVQASPVRARKPVDPSKRLAMQAFWCCKDPVFHAYLYEHDMIKDKPDPAEPAKSEEAATLAVRLICSVDSRADLMPGTPAGEEWDRLVSKFIAWKLAA